MSAPTAAARETEAADSLASLEERIVKAVELVTRLRSENDALRQQIESAGEQREQLEQQLAEAKSQSEKLSAEVAELRTDRRQVRTRIEKLLGQMDLLSAS